jgi:hypothetical protein
MAALKRNVLRFQPAMLARLDELAEMASHVLDRKVSRSAVVRAAVQGWVEAVSIADPALVIEAMKAAIVKRGRKKK